MKTYIKFILGFIIVIGIISYSLYQARNLILGPQIALASPKDGETVQEPLVHILGTAKNISYLSLNDRQIFVDNTGTFSEDLLLSPGYNVWTIRAQDKFGRVVSKKLELILKKT